ncbi:universal stress protein [Microbacterium amylolyticum]|uniref:Nucleotide-binding universal stress UspA family protein n=1 Tax=Microbacterium amylolyticum TaxID=936337 RepID=A0ABS4ZGK9_9MICO|nr:universal stress protein [Microbacterium amylolyticum]MBP2436422.1 nucleotide-binding universal stress UspA family protein [Microbacterium amylolyticum]
MTDATSTPDLPLEQFHGAVIAAIIPEQPPRVITEAARYASLHGVPLVVVHVDVTRFVTYEDPDGVPHTAPIDINVEAGAEELALVQQEVSEALKGSDVEWTTTQLVGDPALAIKHFAEKLDSPLIVLGTRKRGFGESLREFFTGSVAARLSHRQYRPLLVVPIEEPVNDSSPLWDEE